MKKWILAGSAFAFAACLWAQEPQEIRGIIEESRDSVWYAGQVKAWDKVVAQDTLDEKAWRNLFEAAKGLSMVASREGGKAMQAVLALMEQAIPGTFTYNISAYRVQQGPGNAFAEKALKQLPADIRDRGYDAILGYLWMMGDADGEGERADLFNDILRRQYEHGKYPSFILRYDYNQLQGMDEGGLFFGNGDMDLYGKVMLQRVLGVDTDKVLMDRKPCDIVRFLTDLLLPFKVFAGERGVKIRLCSRLSNPCVMMDTAYMRKALVNLVSNAVKFTPDGGRIDVFVTSVREHGTDGGRLLYISVCDTGYGIAEEEIERIFDRFYQSKANDSHPVFGQSGTGIGLFLCRRIVELHGGTVYARNNHGKGASFRILMPLLQGNGTNVSAQEPVAAEHEAGEAGTSPTSDASGRRAVILVAEDNKDMREYICMLLSGDYQLLEAENGEAALQIIQKQTVDLIVSDLMMPVMDGMELSARVKENFATSHIPFLMLTALTSEAQQKKSFEIGVDEYLCKPFDEDVFRLRIRNMLRLRDSYKQKFSVSGKVEDLNIKEDSRDRQFMNKAIGLMNVHYAEAEYDLDSFVRDMGYSKTMVNKKMQALAGQPIGRFMKGYRLNVAQRMLTQSTGDVNISEVAYAVGFNDPKYFTKCYKEFFGRLPSEEAGNE